MPSLIMYLRCRAMTEMPTSGGRTVDDLERVEQLLGRPPAGAFDVVVRDESGDPVVIRNVPLLKDGRPMPTRYWLVGELARRGVDRLESQGGVRRAAAEVDADELAAAHSRYAEERNAALPAGHAGPVPSAGVGGTRQGVKCLHAHYAWYLAGGDDPVGRWVAQQLAAVQVTED
jgi:uncharacterized protein